MEVAADHDSPSHVAPSPPPAALRHVDLGDLAGGLDDAAYLACADAVSEAPASSTVGSSAAPSPTPASTIAGASATTEPPAQPSGTELGCINCKKIPRAFDPKLGRYLSRCTACFEKTKQQVERRNQLAREGAPCKDCGIAPRWDNRARCFQCTSKMQARKRPSGTVDLPADASNNRSAHSSGTGLTCINGKDHAPCVFDPKLGRYLRRCPRCLQKARDDANVRNQRRRDESLCQTCGKGTRREGRSNCVECAAKASVNGPKYAKARAAKARAAKARTQSANAPVEDCQSEQEQEQEDDSLDVAVVQDDVAVVQDNEDDMLRALSQMHAVGALEDETYARASANVRHYRECQRDADRIRALEEQLEAMRRVLQNKRQRVNADAASSTAE